MDVFFEIKKLGQFLQYQFSAKSSKGHGIHSPFMYELVRDIFGDHTVYTELEAIEKIRDQLVRSQETIHYQDLGAGSRYESDQVRKVSTIAKRMSTRPKYGRLLFFLGKKFEPEHIVELGTGLGIGTCYLALSNPGSNVYTLESSTPLRELARAHFTKLGAKNVHMVPGEFYPALDTIKKTVPRFDLVFFDGNHRLESTLDYYNQCLENAHENSIFIFDDIRWSRGMEKAWDIIKNHDRVRVTMDVFQMGVVFFRKALSRQHYMIRY